MRDERTKEHRTRTHRHPPSSQLPAATLPTEEPARVAQCRAAASAADALSRYLLNADAGPEDLLVLRLGDSGDALHVPSSALGLLRDALGELGEGHDVELLPQRREVSTVVAARLLGVSRPHFVKLLERERVMDFHKVGRDRRVRLSDVLAYKRELSTRRSAGLRKLVRHSEDIGLYDDED
jgi:excisionase family DNA binding protein